ncbi:beta-2 adrenergic receptor-like [Exaiptasia diaphana]|uniref:G-protein coupled receptors family 1 profile domain-containing protein n=1 Tax=Exaiptasia diaphana TaxID=2652724 RepID=A0A913X2R0_EXADI|nr:beta-2 adrenergic receptor-like [Exaiptasia diaphana]
MAGNASYLPCLYSLYHIEKPNPTIYITTVTTCFLTFVLSMCGAVANGLVCLAILLNKDLQIYSNLLLLFLSFNDFIVACFAEPLYITRRLLESQNQYLCWLSLTYRALWNISVGLSFQAIAVISAERYFALFHPFKYKEHVTVNRLITTVLLLAGIWVVFVLSRFAGLPTNYFYAITSPMILICIIMIAVVHVKIFKLARWHHRQISLNTCSPQNEVCHTRKWMRYTAREAKIAKSTAFVVGAVFLCYLPLIVIVITNIILTHQDVLFHYYILPWTDFLVFLNSLLNPVIYCWRSRELRSSIVRLCKRETRVTDQQNSVTVNNNNINNNSMNKS